MVEETLISTFPFVNWPKKPSHIPLGDYLRLIKKPDPRVCNLIKKIRSAKEKAVRDQEKLRLPCISPAGIFRERYDSQLIKMSGVICLDLDHIFDLDKERQRLLGDQRVFSFFVSPSGDGLKVFVKHDLQDPNLFPAMYMLLGDDMGFANRTDMKFDNSCSNISHSCFYSFDPNIYINKDSTVYHFEESRCTPATIQSLPSSKLSKFDYIQQPVKVLTDKKQIEKAIICEHERFEKFHSLYPGNRNNMIYLLSGFFRNAGIPKQDAINYLVAYYSNPVNGLLDSEITTTVQSSYTGNPNI